MVCLRSWGLMGLSQFVGSHQLDGQQLHQLSLAESQESASLVQKSDYLEIWEISVSRNLDVMYYGISTF